MTEEQRKIRRGSRDHRIGFADFGSPAPRTTAPPRPFGGSPMRVRSGGHDRDLGSHLFCLDAAGKFSSLRFFTFTYVDTISTQHPTPCASHLSRLEIPEISVD